jgi:hypothetical protein
MDVVFGIWADGGAWPEHGGTGTGALGSPVVGPLGLLDVLETARGLGAPAVANVVRIAALQAAAEQMHGPPRFWSRSLAVDGWATARTLLRWRDELIGAGWTATGNWSSSRLADLAALESSATLPLGTSDRIARLNAELSRRQQLPIQRIRLIDPRRLHSVGWRRLLDRLEQCGVRIEEIGTSSAAPEDSALGRLQRWIQNGTRLSGDADGTFTVAGSGSTILAADIVGQWFGHNNREGAVLIAQGSDTHLLDHGLCNAGQPRAGRSRPSPHRGSLQLLLLAFKVGWAPFDPRALMELLVFPTSPLSGRAARILADALEEAPGRGGPIWQAAWAEITDTELAKAAGDPAAVRKAEARLERWRAWANPILADAVKGMPLQSALETCDRTLSWALARYSRSGDPLYQATAALAEDVRKAFVALRRDHLPRILVERIIDQALDLGQDNPLAEAEAAQWRCLPQPGAIWGPTPTVIWWNFTATQEGLYRQPWTEAERKALNARGCVLDDADLAAQAASAAWERAVLNTREHLVLLASGLNSGDDEALHPLAHRIAPAIDVLATYVSIEDALAKRTLTLAGIELARSPVSLIPVAAPRAWWATPARFNDRLADRYQSATSFENVLACQLMWALKHVARLRPGYVRSIPDASQLLGNLAHQLAQKIFAPGPPPSAQHAERRARELLETLIDELAAPLRLSELATDLENARERLPLAMAQLARTLSSNELQVEATELEVNRTFKGPLPVRGVVDLLARDINGHRVIIDLKWTRSASRRLEELKIGKAVQLSTYGALTGNGAPYRAGYFLLNQRQFLTLAQGGLKGRPVESERDYTETWSALLESWRGLIEVARGGALVARGVEGWEERLPELPLLREVNCGWCDYQTVCRVKGME